MLEKAIKRFVRREDHRGFWGETLAGQDPSCASGRWSTSISGSISNVILLGNDVVENWGQDYGFSMWTCVDAKWCATSSHWLNCERGRFIFEVLACDTHDLKVYGDSLIKTFTNTKKKNKSQEIQLLVRCLKVIHTVCISKFIGNLIFKYWFQWILACTYFCKTKKDVLNQKVFKKCECYPYKYATEIQISMFTQFSFLS